MKDRVGTVQNDIGLEGIEFIEFAAADPKPLDRLFKDFGFSRLMRHKDLSIDYYRQNQIHFLVNTTPGSFAWRFQQAHGPCVPSMGWRVKDAKKALATAVQKGAKPAVGDFALASGEPLPAIFGIGESLIYFIDQHQTPQWYQSIGFKPLEKPDLRPDKGFMAIDHLTNNVPQGTMSRWSDFYKGVFGFYEVRYFDIRGAKTGLTSYALRSPCGTFCIPINEGTEAKSQINEYLQEYKGPGVQHIALSTPDIIKSLRALRDTSIKTLDIDDQYYDEVFNRVPNVTEDRKALRDLNILVDGDEEGYLLQIFTHNLVGPIFIEMIQRKNHLAFGEGNFGALFRAIERDQERRGVL